MHELVVISSIKWAIRWSERGFPRDPLQAAERQFLIYVRFPNQHKTPFSQVSCHKYKQLQFQMRPDSINFAANFRFGTAFPPFPTNYPQRVGQRELWRRVRSPDLMRWFLGLIVLLCVKRYLLEMWIFIYLVVKCNCHQRNVRINNHVSYMIQALVENYPIMIPIAKLRGKLKRGQL